MSLKLPVASASGSLVTRIDDFAPTEVLGGEARAALEPDHLHARLAEPGRAHADDHDIGLFRCHGSCPPAARRHARLGPHAYLVSANSKMQSSRENGLPGGSPAITKSYGDHYSRGPGFFL